MRERFWRWAPSVVMTAGVVLTMGIDRQRAMGLDQPLDAAVPERWGPYRADNLSLTPGEARAAGVHDYLLREYRPAADSAYAFSVYIGYYPEQTQGRTIHSPKNCLPGSGWESLGSREVLVPAAGRDVPVNRYVLQKGDERALVLYWYQGRGRVEANEYRVKWDLLRDSALRGRSEEALVRIVVPIRRGEEDAFALATSVAADLVPAVYQSLPS